MHNITLVGIAIGGPRDRVKLSCPMSWHGKIVRPNMSHIVDDSGCSIRKDAYYDGHYVWSLQEHTWVWEPDHL